MPIKISPFGRNDSRAFVIPSEGRNLIIPLRVISPRNLISLYVRLIARVAKNRIENQNLSNAGLNENLEFSSQKPE